VRGVLTPLTSACWFSPRVGAAKKLRVKSVLLDGEAVIYREDGAADFDKLHSRCFEGDVVLYAFDLIELNGSDLSKRPLDERKKVLAQLLKRPLRNNAE
jgi:bifunctional non-homologous end joining protein LigD